MPERKAEIKYYNITCQKESQKLISIYTLVVPGWEEKEVQIVAISVTIS